MKNDPNAMTPGQIKILQSEVDEIKQITHGFRKALANDDGKSDIEIECVVCLEEPKEIVFLCNSECESIMCKPCKEQLAKCPVCRVSFEKTPPKRSRGFERILNERKCLA